MRTSLMLFKKFTLTLVAAFTLFSAKTNATSITANKCTLGLFPFGTTMSENTKKDQIIKAYEAKGFFVTELKSQSEIQDVEYISDASVNCTSTYFGILAKTSVRLIETSTSKTISETTSPSSMEMFSCKIDLFSAINLLPDCQIK